MLNELHDKTGEQLVRSVVFNDFRVYAIHWAETDDLLGEGFLGLVRAVNQYDQSRGVEFTTFACWKIKQAIIDYLRLNRTKNAFGLMVLEDYDRCYNPDTEAIVESADFAEQLMSCLTNEQKKIIHKTYWQDESEREIAKDLKVSKTYIHLTKRYAMQKMRDRGNFLLKKGGYHDKSN